MSKRAIVLLTGSGVLLISVVIWKIVSSGVSTDARRASLPLVRIQQPSRESVVRRLTFNGDILPVQQANIFSKVTGNLDRIFVDMGTAVGQNQLLALIDTTELFQQFQQSSAKYHIATLNYDRTKELASRNLVARQDLDNAESNLRVTRSDFDNASTKLAYARITAPFSGFITRRFLDQGALVTANNATLFTLMDISEMKVLVNVLEKDIPLIQKGRRATISVDAYPGKEFTGVITRVSEAVDLATRTMAVEIRITNRDHLLKPGMFGHIELPVDEHPGALVVPTQAIQRDDAGYYVFVVDSSTAHRRAVTVGVEHDARTEILTGLAASDMIVTAGQQFARDGSPVLVKNQ